MSSHDAMCQLGSCSLARICWKLSGLGCLHILTVVRLLLKWPLS